MSKRINYQAVAWCLNSFAQSITYPFIPLYLMNERNLPIEKVAAFFPIIGIGRMVGGPVAGWLVDNIGRRKILLAAPLLRSLCYFILASLVFYVAPIWMFALMLFFAMMLGNVFQSASDSYITDITLPEERTEAFSRLRVGLNVGFAAGPMIGALLSRTPYSLLFSVTGTVCLMTAYAAYPRWDTLSKGKTDEGEPAALSLEIHEKPFWKVLAEDGLFTWLLFFGFALYAVHFQLVTTLTIYTTNFIGISKNLLGLLYGINGGMIIFLLIPVNRMLKGISMAKRVGMGAFLYALGYFGVGLCSNFWHLLLCFIIFTVGEILADSSLIEIVSRLAPKRYIGRYVGMYGLVHGLGNALGPYFGTKLIAIYANEPTTAWLIISVFTVVAGYGFFRLNGKIKSADSRHLFPAGNGDNPGRAD